MQEFPINPVPPWKQTQFAGSHLACDFVNTLSDRIDTEKAVERLHAPELVISWCRSTGLSVPDSADGFFPADAEEARIRLITFREHVYAVLSAVAGGRDIPQRSFEAVLKTASGTVPQPVERSSVGMLSLSAEQISDLQSLAGLIAHQTLSLLFSGDRKRLRACGRCGWLFYDRSRPGKRRWCNMSLCGNREKAKRHYQRAH